MHYVKRQFFADMENDGMLNSLCADEDETNISYADEIENELESHIQALEALFEELKGWFSYF